MLNYCAKNEWFRYWAETWDTILLRDINLIHWVEKIKSHHCDLHRNDIWRKAPEMFLRKNCESLSLPIWILIKAHNAKVCGGVRDFFNGRGAPRSLERHFKMLIRGKSNYLPPSENLLPRFPLLKESPRWVG